MQSNNWSQDAYTKTTATNYYTHTLRHAWIIHGHLSRTPPTTMAVCIKWENYGQHSTKYSRRLLECAMCVKQLPRLNFRAIESKLRKESEPNWTEIHFNQRLRPYGARQIPLSSRTFISYRGIRSTNDCVYIGHRTITNSIKYHSPFPRAVLKKVAWFLITTPDYPHTHYLASDQRVSSTTPDSEASSPHYDRASL